ncbi:MAG: hypothetical protein SF339_10105 [Blastocatellia bacterium]|nr:hypothetical protein [Blastocatellia bacterium]
MKSIAFALLLAGLLAVPASTQETTRRLWDSDLFKTQSKKTAPAKRRYRIATPQLSPEKVDGDSVLGITLWRLRPARTTDDKRVRLLKHARDNARNSEWTPERIDTGTPLTAGQRLRLSIEAARDGYLYVVDRELYADGSMGDPYLIFPTLSIRKGDNRVAVGKIFDIPNDETYFILEPSRPDQIGEVLTVLVSPHPLEGFTIGEQEVPISKELLASWEKSWGAQIGRLDLETGAGQPWTKAERDAAANKRTLQADSPPPQSLFYRPAAKPGDPLLANVKLRYGATRK